MRPIETSLATVLYRTLDSILPEFREILLEFRLTETQWRVLRTLWDREPREMGEISRVALVPGPSLVGVIDRLEGGDLVRRVPSSDDRRRVRVELTRHGRALQRKVEPRVDAAHERLDARLTKTQWKQLFRLLEAVCREPEQS